MRPPHSLLSPIAAALALLFASPAWPWADRQGPVANVRPFVELGYDTPVWFEGYHQGAGLGFGLEVEQSPGISFLLRLEWSNLVHDRPSPPPFGFYDYGGGTLALTKWSLGARGYLRSRDWFRPYAEICAGLRMAEGLKDAEGVLVAPRIGFELARGGGPGLALDGGVDFRARAPRLYGVVPVRLAIVFP